MDWQLTTDDNGKFQMVIPRRTLEVGNYKLTASFAGDNYYTSASAEKNIHIRPNGVIFSLSLTGTRVISSGDSTTITATLLGDDSPFNDAVLDYEIKQGNTTISTGTTSMTDANGQTTISYTGTGAGDIDIIVSYGSYIQETFTIEDCYYYDSLTVDKNRYTVISGSPSLSYGDNGLTITSNVSQVGLVRNNALTLPNDYEAEVTITNAPSGQYCGGICFDDWLYDAGAANVAYTYKLSNTSALSSNIQKFVTGDVFKVVKQGTSMKLYLNDTLIVTNTISNDTHYQHFRTYLNRITTYKDLKIKAL